MSIAISASKNVNAGKRLRANGVPFMTGIAPAHDPEKCEAVFRKDHAQTRM
jgi:hypothetical protein